MRQSEVMTISASCSFDFIQ